LGIFHELVHFPLQQVPRLILLSLWLCAVPKRCIST
jgi:hypothetical protein